MTAITDEPRLVVSGGHKIRISADEQSLLWCHPTLTGSRLFNDILTPDKKVSEEVVKGNACGESHPHCELTCFLILTSTIRENGFYDWALETPCESFKPLTIANMCVVCPTCHDHMFIIEDVVFTSYTGYMNNGVSYGQAMEKFRKRGRKLP